MPIKGSVCKYSQLAYLCVENSEYNLNVYQQTNRQENYTYLHSAKFAVERKVLLIHARAWIHPKIMVLSERKHQKGVLFLF